MSRDLFSWHGELLPYLDHPYNTARLNERAVEVPCAALFVAEAILRWGTVGGLEVGNVLQHYGMPNHRTVDLHEEAEGVENIDVMAVDWPSSWIVSISTVEHVGEVSGDLADSVRAVEHLRSLLTPDGRMLVTAPLGVNPALDEALAAGEVGVARECTFLRSQEDPLVWEQHAGVVRRPYGVRPPGWAQAVWIGEWWPEGEPPPGTAA